MLKQTVPQRFGGTGQPLSVLLDTARSLAQVDPTLAHVFAFHHLILYSVRLFIIDGRTNESLANRDIVSVPEARRRNAVVARIDPSSTSAAPTRCASMYVHWRRHDPGGVDSFVDRSLNVTAQGSF